MTLGDEIREYQKSATASASKALQWVLDKMSERGRLAGSQARDKKRGDSAYYRKLANERWKK